MRTIFIFMALLASTVAHAYTINGKVVRVADGDTLTVLDAKNKTHKVRLAGIDAPEKAQDFGEKSKQSLSAHTFGKAVIADCSGRDRYERNICKILLNDQDINLAQIANGLAWHYKAYAKAQTGYDQSAYAAAQDKAAANRLGLWAEVSPVAPWSFRRGEKQEVKAEINRESDNKNTELVKMSRSRICHDTRSKWYDRTTNFEPYNTIQQCLEAGGRLPKR